MDFYLMEWVGVTDILGSDIISGKLHNLYDQT
jgi:hypothetical protein